MAYFVFYFGSYSNKLVVGAGDKETVNILVLFPSSPQLFLPPKSSKECGFCEWAEKTNQIQ